MQRETRFIWKVGMRKRGGMKGKEETKLFFALNRVAMSGIYRFRFYQRKKKMTEVKLLSVLSFLLYIN